MKRAPATVHHRVATFPHEARWRQYVTCTCGWHYEALGESRPSVMAEAERAWSYHLAVHRAIGAPSD